MKITVYSTKGSAWKTPISMNMVYDRGYSIGTNEPYHIFDQLLPDSQFLALDLNDAFPEIPDDIDIVFDLAGSLSSSALSISSAIKQSDVVIVPIYNEIKAINAGLNTIAEVLQINKNVIVVATKLQKKKRSDVFADWWDSEDARNIKEAVHRKIGDHIPVLPLKFSAAFDLIFEQEKSLQQLTQTSWLAKYQFQEVGDQFQKIYNLIDMYGK